MNIHVLAGDSLAAPFGETEIDGEVFVCRECLVDGDAGTDSLEGFWLRREAYLAGNYEKEEGFYEDKVKNEFIRLWNRSEGNNVNLWFERELFCQVNLWFTIWLLRNTEATMYVVYPKLAKDTDIWKGFSFLNSNELKTSFEERIKLNHDDIYLGVQLWEAFQARDFEKLSDLGSTESKAFPTLKEVCEAAVEIETRPRNSLAKIIESGAKDFGAAFKAFNETEAIYGLGDLQVKKLYDEVIADA